VRDRREWQTREKTASSGATASIPSIAEARDESYDVRAPKIRAGTVNFPLGGNRAGIEPARQTSRRQAGVKVKHVGMDKRRRMVRVALRTLR